MKQLLAVAVLLGGCAFEVGGPTWTPDPLTGEPDGGGAVEPEIDAGGGPADAEEPAGEMLTIPVSAFARGCAASDVLRCRSDELPERSIELSRYEIDRYEVTNAEYKRCVEQGGCTEASCESEDASGEEEAGGGADQPVVCVTWFQARDYCSWRGKRLPTEAEWEKAARGEEGAFYPWGDEPEPSCELANFGDCSGELEEVGRHPGGQSPYGAHDMAGNAYEWVNDWYGPGYYATAPTVDPQGPDAGEDRVARGGSFAWGAVYLRASGRSRNDPSTAFSDLGFRCAR